MVRRLQVKTPLPNSIKTPLLEGKSRVLFEFLFAGDKEEISWKHPDLAKLGEPHIKMNEETAENIMKPITMEELRINIDDLDRIQAKQREWI